MVAVKGNVEYTINDTEKDYYIKNGFDILDAKGNKIANGEHKTVSYEKYKELHEKYEKLKAEKTNNEEVEALKVKIKELEGDKEDLNGQIAKLQDELKKAKK